MVKIKFYFLLLIKEKTCRKDSRDGKPYNKISEEAREVIRSVFCDTFNFVPEPGSDASNHEIWYTLKGKIDKSDTVIRHYKMRIILEIEKQYCDDSLASLFLKARQERGELAEQQLGTLIESLRKKDSIDQIFKYPLIEVLKDYNPEYFKTFGLEPITTFFYEVPDYRFKRSLQKIIPIATPKTIIRLSRPSVITSKMSDFMRTEVINIIYDTCLYDQREKSRLGIDDNTFRRMKEYFGNILFNTETLITNVEITKSLHTLSLLMSLGALAAILAIITCVPYLCAQNTSSLKSLLGGFMMFLLLALWVYFLKR